ncbi:MAG: hypothetical protein GXP49_00150 [Deltaproteobacteria bacterium]|nr:hypothetical protein [Deltaproteobacteria bacterium]
MLFNRALSRPTCSGSLVSQPWPGNTYASAVCTGNSAAESNAATIETSVTMRLEYRSMTTSVLRSACLI